MEKKIINDRDQLQKHIENYCKGLFGREERNEIKLQEDVWIEKGRLNIEEGQMLTASFTLEEIETSIKEMKNNTAPGPDGLSV